MSTLNTNFVFGILHVVSGDVSFVTNDITVGEIISYYPNNEVIYMPYFQLDDGDVLNYCGEEFTSFEALVEEYGYDALNETIIFNPNNDNKVNNMPNPTPVQPKYDITNKAIIVKRDDIEEAQHTLFALGCVWSGDTQGELLDELYGSGVELLFLIDDNKEMVWATSYQAYMGEVEVLTFTELTQAIAE